MPLNSSGRQDDGSIVDIYGNVISQKDSLQIRETVSGLPALRAKDDFLHALDNNRVTIVQGETGSGKSTQLPKFAHFARPNSNIVATQPRVISATSLAERVSREILVELYDTRYSLGQKVGYRTGGAGKNASHDTRIAYHTAGTEFMRQSLSHKIPDILFIDEAHGFSVETEMLAMLSRQRDHAMQIVIMSATLDPEVFREYYKGISRDIPLIEIPGRTYPVEKNFDRDGSLMTDLRTAINAREDVLIFVPGKKEIQAHIELIRKQYGDEIEVFPLHAELPISQQNALLTKTTTKPRIIVATNIAEESITIPYLRRVIDLGQVRTLRYDAHGTPILLLENTALSQVYQRAGRVGRTRPGIYDRYNNTFSEDLEKYPSAPIEREMIDRQILTLLSHGLDIVELIFEGQKRGESPFFHKVDINLFTIALARLRSIGAITKDNRLTILGNQLLKFPVDVYHARMLYESIDRGCIANVLPIVAILEKKGFLSKEGSWRDILSQKSYSSDLEAQVEILRICTASELTRKQEQKLVELGISNEELTIFRERAGDKKLYEIVNLEILGIKSKKLKEIDQCNETLTSLFASMSIPITESTDTRGRAIAIATGYLHNQYTYSTETKGFTHSYQGQYADKYKQGDTSVVVGIDKGHYLGSPFIIGGTGEMENFHILTQIMSLANGVIGEANDSNALHSNDLYIPPRATKNNTIPKKGSKKGMLEDTERGISVGDIDSIKIKSAGSSHKTRVLNTEMVSIYEPRLTEFQSVRHASTMDAQSFYLRYCLIPFLIEQNKHIRLYIQDKDKDWKQTFVELLKGFIGEHDRYRINPDNIPKTEASFRQDADLMRRFQESPNLKIQEFIIHGRLARVTQELPNPTMLDGISKKNQTKEVMDLKAEYASVLGRISPFIRHISLTEIEELVLAKTLDELNNSKGLPAAVGAYSQILCSMRDIQELSTQEGKELMLSTKRIGARMKEYQKYYKRYTYLAHIYEVLENPGSDEKDMILLAMNEGCFGEMNKSDRARFETFLSRLTSEDKRKKSRAQNSKTFGTYLDMLKLQIKQAEEMLFSLKDGISLSNSPMAKDILHGLRALVGSLFDSDYASTVIDPKLYKIMRALIGDALNENKGASTVMFELLKTEHIGEHMNGISKVFMQLVAHEDVQYELETYNLKGAIGLALQDSVDPIEIGKYIKGLRTIHERLESTVRGVDSNPLWKLYTRGKLVG